MPEVASIQSRIDDTEVTVLLVIVSLLAVGALGVLYQRSGLRRDSRQFAPPGRLIDAGGHRLHSNCQGHGEPVVLLESGIAASSLSWAGVQPDIAAFTRVCAYDRAGLAWSDAPSSPRTFERIVDELSAVLASVAPTGRSVLVGHSFGGFVVLAYAARHPEHIAGVVLVDPAVEWLVASPERARLLRGGRLLSRLGVWLAYLGVVRASLTLLTGGRPGAPRQFAKIFGPTAARTLERLVGEVRKLPPEIHPLIQAHWCQPKCFRAMADHLATLERDAMAIAAVQPPREVPLVVISSGDQPREQIAAHRKLADASAAGRHHVAARSTHWVQFDEPELVVGVIKELVEKARGPQRTAATAASSISR